MELLEANSANHNYSPQKSQKLTAYFFLNKPNPLDKIRLWLCALSSAHLEASVLWADITNMVIY